MFLNYKHIVSETAMNTMIYVQVAGRFICDQSYMIKRKKYDSMLLIYTLEGKGCLKYGNKQYEMSKGEGCIIECNEPHVYFTGDCDEWEFLWVHFKGGQSTEQIKFILGSSGPIYSDSIDGLVLNSMRNILEWVPNKGVYYDIVLSDYLNQILHYLMISALHTEEKKYKPEVVSKALNMIESQFSCNITLDDIAEKLYTNKYYLIRVFKKYMGITPYGYLIKYRISQSKTLLETTSLPISDIAAKVGFDDTSYFIKVFRQHENITPLAYRKYWNRR